MTFMRIKDPMLCVVLIAILVSSPAVGWNRGELVGRVEGFFEEGVPRPLYVASAAQDFRGSLKQILNFANVVGAAARPEDPWRHESFPNDTHYSLHHQSTYRGLEFLYQSWPVPDEARRQFERAYELAREQSAPDLAEYKESLDNLTAKN